MHGHGLAIIIWISMTVFMDKCHDILIILYEPGISTQICACADKRICRPHPSLQVEFNEPRDLAPLQHGYYSTGMTANS